MVRSKCRQNVGGGFYTLPCRGGIYSRPRIQNKMYGRVLYSPAGYNRFENVCLSKGLEDYLVVFLKLMSIIKIYMLRKVL